MLRSVLRRLTPANVNNIYHRTRKRLGHDAHEIVSPTTLRHVGRYLFASELVKGLDVLDVACGSGYGSLVLKETGSYRGIDVDPGAIRQARESFPGGRYILGSIYQLPQGDGVMGAVVSFETLEHVDKPERLVAEIARVLKPGGVLVGSIPINHPDRVYHHRPYTAAEAAAIFMSSPFLMVRDFFVQDDMMFTRGTREWIEENAATGALIAVMENVQL